MIITRKMTFLLLSAQKQAPLLSDACQTIKIYALGVTSAIALAALHAPLM